MLKFELLHEFNILVSVLAISGQDKISLMRQIFILLRLCQSSLDSDGLFVI